MESFRRNKKGIIMMALAAVLAATGQFFWKLSSGNDVWFIVLGFALYGMGALLMLSAYKFGKVSVLQPMLSINYIISTLLGGFVLRERISLTMILGIGIIVTGIVFVAGGDSDE